MPTRVVDIEAEMRRHPGIEKVDVYQRPGRVSVSYDATQVSVGHALFALVGLAPDRDVRLAEQANFELNHTLFLNLLALAVAAVLLGLRRARAKREQAGAPAGKA